MTKVEHINWNGTISALYCEYKCKVASTIKAIVMGQARLAVYTGKVLRILAGEMMHCTVQHMRYSERLLVTLSLRFTANEDSLAKNLLIKIHIHENYVENDFAQS